MHSKITYPRSAKGVENRRVRLSKLPLGKMESWLHGTGTRGKKPRDVRERFMEKITKEPNGCWTWTGTIDATGYGLLCVRDKMVRATHLSLLFHGIELPAGQFACHRCDNPKCVNPDHLFAGTPRENTQDALAKTRMLKGEKNGQSKLITEDVLMIRARHAAGTTVKELAAEFGVWPAAISKIIHRTRWAHVL